MVAAGHHAPNRGKGRAIKFVRDHVNYQGDDCVLWPFALMPNGYGHFGFEGEMHYPHRYICELAHGAPPTTKHQAAHSCHNRACINPRHLSWKTLSGNMLDKRENGTQAIGRVYKLTTEEVAEIRELVLTMSVPAVAAKFGVCESTIRHIRAGRTWKTGAKSPRQFTAEEIAAIQALHGSKTTREIAVAYGVGPTAIWRIQNGRR